MKHAKALWETVATIGAAILLALGIQAFLVKPYRIPSASMEPTLNIGQRVLVNRQSGDVHVGDVVVFNPPSGVDDASASPCAVQEPDGTPCGKATSGKSSQTFIKRVVGLGGDKLTIQAGHVIRNGVREKDPYIAPCADGSGCDLPHAVTVPKGTIYLMGDNRGDSDDSRFWGPLPTGWVIGKAFATYWPPGRIGGL
jgi:signal peptidase I